MDDQPFLPYSRQCIEADDVDAIAQAVCEEFLTTGPTVQRFEQALAARVDSAWAVVLANGTAALHAACAACGVGPGSEVLVPAIGFVADANCVAYLGATPIFVDVHPDTGLLDCDAAVAQVNENVKAIIVVDLTGRAADIARLVASIDADVAIIEDAAHALGATRQSRPVGAGDNGATVTTFSFHPVKLMTTGEGGAVVGNAPELESRLRTFCNHGITRTESRFHQPSPGPWYYEQQTLGFNYRLTDIQAALGLSQLAKLDRFLHSRRVLAARYDELLTPIDWIQPVVPSVARDSSAYHLYSVLIDFTAIKVPRVEVMDGLRRRGIGTQVHYIPIPMQPYYASRGWDVGAFPGAISYYERVLSLPMFPTMDRHDVDRVVEQLQSVVS